MLGIKNLNIKIILVSFIGLIPFEMFAESVGPDEYQEMVKGTNEAKNIIIEYASFTCSHCADFHKEMLPFLQQKFIDTGKVKFVYREVYFDKSGLWAGLLARCASPQKYFGIVDLLYKKQATWAFEKSDKEILKRLFSIGRQVGIEEEKIRACLQNKNKSLNLIDAYLANSKSDQISATPSLVVNGKLLKYSSYDDLKAKLDELLN